MAEEDPCGSETESKFLQNYENVTAFTQQTLQAVLQATKSSNEMPAAGDDFDYYSSFQGFQDVMNIEGKRILHIIQGILKHQNVKVNLGTSGGAADVEDKLDLLMDANDQILERAGGWLDEASGLKKTDSTLVVASATPKLVSTASWNKKTQAGASPSTPSYRLLSARNIQRPQLKFKTKVDNRRRPFIPIIKVKPNAMKSLDESLKLPEGITPEMADEPDFMYPHPYQYEMDMLQYTEGQLATCEPQKVGPLSLTPMTMVTTVEELKNMIALIKYHSKEIAVDLEHHSYRTFQGITCLIQISTRSQDFVVDALELRSDLHLLNEVFTDPAITKVLHGADSDIDWLQRDFGLYVVNMFDTGQAARVLNFSRFGLAHLLQHYCNVNADKQYQMADWRMRPLPDELLKYAREDTHYLLYIYDMLKNELIERGNEHKNLLLSVLQRSKHIAAKVYKKPLLKDSDYMDLYRKNKKVFNSQQMMALGELYSWRDEVARLEDESVGYILPNHMLLQICGILPREKQGVLACCNPIPPLVRQYLNEIHAIIAKARESPLHKIEVVKETQPTQLHHPKYDVNSLLNCPHDLSHAGEMIEHTRTSTALLDQSLVSKSSSLYPVEPVITSLIVLKEAPILTALGYPRRMTRQSEAQKKAAEIKTSFVSPYYKYLPKEENTDIEIPVKQGVESWKLVPSTVKRKPSGDSGAGPPPSKKRKQQSSDTPESSNMDLDSPTQVPSGAVLSTSAMSEDREAVPALTEDDKKALPHDLEIPLRFKMPSKKKKKKNRNRDIDIIQAVQDSVQTELERIKNATLALGENKGDDQAIVIDKEDKPTVKKDKKLKKVKKEKKTQSEESVKGGKKDEVVVIDSDDGASSEKTEEFKPYDYTGAAQKLTQGSAQQKDYFDPIAKMKKSKGPKASKSKMNKKKGIKSMSWKT